MDFETRQNWVDRWLGVMDEVQQDPKLMELYLKENKDDDFDVRYHQAHDVVATLNQRH